MQLGRYQLLARIASGGMADVFKAKLIGIEGFEKIVAVKKILPHWSSNREFINMLVDEARTLLYLTHANIVQVFELGLEGEDYYLVMEYIDGVDLRKLQNKCKDLNKDIAVPVLLYIAKEISRGLQYAHEKRDKKRQPLKIVHRDISPQNILLGFEGDIKITDFGIAKVMGKTHETAAGTLKGKFSYMSPEQATGQDVNAQTDLFALGIILFEMVTGQRCFKGESDIETLEAVKKAEVVFPSDKETVIPEGLKKIILKLLKKNLDERYVTAAEVIDDILHLELVLGISGAKEELIYLLKKGFSYLQDADFESTTIDVSGSHLATIIQTQTEVDRRTKILVGPDTIQEESKSQDTPFVVNQQSKAFEYKPIIKFGLIVVLFAVVFGFMLKWIILSTDVSKEKVSLKKETPTSIETKPTINEPTKEPLPLVTAPLVTPIAKKQEVLEDPKSDNKIKMADVSSSGFYEIKVQPEGADIRVRYDANKSYSGKNSVRQEFKLETDKSFFVSVEKKGYVPQTFRFSLTQKNPVFVKEVYLSKSSFGSLHVGATPWGRVSIPGIVANSEVPFDRLKVPAGTYTLKVMYPPNQKTISKSVTIPENGAIYCQANFVATPSLICK